MSRKPPVKPWDKSVFVEVGSVAIFDKWSEISFFLPPGLSRGITWCADTVFDEDDDSWH